jgi:hypothetical protein
MAEPEERYRLASTTSYKNRVVEHLVNLHPDDHILVIGQYLDQLDEISTHLGVPTITGATPTAYSSATSLVKSWTATPKCNCWTMASTTAGIPISHKTTSPGF